MLCLLITGCSGSGTDDKTALEQTPEKTRGAGPSCLYGFTQGPLAPVNLLSEKITETYFGKKFDENKLIPLMNVSGSETVKFAEKTNVRFYKTNYFSNNSCAYTQSLPRAPADIREIFEKGGENVLGLYLPKNQSNFVTLESESAIQVRIDSDRWTLTHEFMHHLFSTVSSQSGLSDDKLKDEITKNLKLYEDATATATATASVSDTQIYAKASKNLILLNNLFQELMRRFSLEEMTIESILGKKYDQSQFLLVAESQRENGAYYIVASADKAIQPMQRLLVRTKKVLMILWGSTDPEILKSIQLLNENVENYNKLISELNTLESAARTYIIQRGSVSSSDRNSIHSQSGQSVKHIKGHCSHSDQIDDIIGQINF